MTVTKTIRNFSLLFLILFAFTQCQQVKENADQVLNQIERTIYKPNLNAPVLGAYDLQIDSVSSIGDDIDQTSPKFIKKRIEEMYGNSMRYWTEKAGLQYPPKQVLFRTFKKEKEFEIWGSNSAKDTMKLLTTFEICAGDDEPMPKTRQGDWKTPEGFYHLTTLYGSELRWMWIDLEEDYHFITPQVGQGSSYKLWLNYPNNFDRSRTKAIHQNQVSTGGEICIHGNCVSAGCISFENNLYSAVFGFSQYHSHKKFGKPQIHIFPFRFQNEKQEDYLQDLTEIEKQEIKQLWKMLEKGDSIFNKTKKPLKWKVNKNGYRFK